MKIKITLIAFFASVLFLTSCMKNEVSPGINEVRSAYAALLTAKAQAEIILANSQAAIDQANAAMIQANAAYRLAETETTLAALEHAINMYAITLAAAQRVEDAAMDAYLASVQAAADSAAMRYYVAYTNALATQRAAQTAIFNKNALIVGLAIDVVNGTTLTYDSLVADLALKNASLDFWTAEYEAAKALLGDPAAIEAKILELNNDTTDLQAQVNALLIQKQELTPAWQDEQDDYNDASSAYADDLADWNEAKYLLSKSDSVLAADYPAPQFWIDAVDSLDYADSVLTAKYGDTVLSYNAWDSVVTLIASGTTAEVAAYDLKNDSVTDYLADIAALQSDSSTTWANYVTDSLYATQAARDTVVADSLQNVLVLNMASWYFAWNALPYGPVRTQDSTYYAQGYIDSTNYVDVLEPYANTITVPAANNAETASRNLWIAAKAAWDAPACQTDLIAFLGVSTSHAATDLYGRRYLANQAITNKAAAIVTAEAARPDLYSTYLYHQTFLAQYIENVALADAYKESLRPAYETYMEEFYASLMQTLQDDVDATYAAKELTKQAKADALALLTAAKAEWTEVGAQIAALGLEKADVVALLAVYMQVSSYNGDLLDYFENATTGKLALAQNAIDNTEANILAAEKAYAAKKITYDEYVIELASLEAELQAATAQVAFWKALLDEAIANL